MGLTTAMGYGRLSAAHKLSEGAVQSARLTLPGVLSESVCFLPILNLSLAGQNGSVRFSGVAKAWPAA
jgi:hypothetical protein